MPSLFDIFIVELADVLMVASIKLSYIRPKEHKYL